MRPVAPDAVETPPDPSGPAAGRPDVGAAADGRPADPVLTRALSRLLLVGLLLAIALMLVGAILAALQGSGSVRHSTSLRDFPRLLAEGDPTGFLDLGLLVLLATPAARVIALLVAFTRHREWLFAGISGVVIAILVLSAILGFRLS